MRTSEFIVENSIPTIGINVRNDKDIDYASLIVDGKKKYESRKTDSLRPYVGKTVGIVRTGNGPAVAIGQVTLGEPIIVDAEKFNKLRNQHLVPQGSKFDIDSDGTKYLYPMINPVRWDNEKPIKHKGIVSRKIQEQDVTKFID
jgi:predicted transcriptional regulator